MSDKHTLELPTEEELKGLKWYAVDKGIFQENGYPVCTVYGYFTHRIVNLIASAPVLLQRVKDLEAEKADLIENKKRQLQCAADRHNESNSEFEKQIAALQAENAKLTSICKEITEACEEFRQLDRMLWNAMLEIKSLTTYKADHDKILYAFKDAHNVAKSALDKSVTQKNFEKLQAENARMREFEGLIKQVANLGIADDRSEQVHKINALVRDARNLIKS